MSQPSNVAAQENPATIMVALVGHPSGQKLKEAPKGGYYR